jgi:hypothetical protein
MSARNQVQESDVLMSNTTASILTVLSRNEIYKRAPQVYTKEPMNSKVSKKYTFIPTYQIIEDMKTLGWEVCQAVTMKTSDANQKKYGKHMIKFFNPAISIQGEDGQPDAYPQILVINNHRGWGRFRFEVGIFRLVCSNGLVVKDKDMGSFVMRHLGYSFAELQELVGKAVQALPNVVKKINFMESTIMTGPQMTKFATEALKLRMGKDTSPSDSELAELLRPYRKEDEGNSIWRVFNRVQEKLIKGGFTMANNAKKERKVRSINNMLKDVELNQQLWSLTDELVTV